jgi:hypothetical protein
LLPATLVSNGCHLCFASFGSPSPLSLPRTHGHTRNPPRSPGARSRGRNLLPYEHPNRRPPLIGAQPLWYPDVAHDSPARIASFPSFSWFKPRLKPCTVAREHHLRLGLRRAATTLYFALATKAERSIHSRSFPHEWSRLDRGVTPSAGLPWTREPWSTAWFMAASAPTSAAQPTTTRHVATHQQIHRRQPPFCTKAPVVLNITTMSFHLLESLHIGPCF